MSKVYVPQRPSRFDRAIQQWVPSVNLDPAKEFGEIFVMLPPEASRLETVPLSRALREKMRDFGQDDYMIAVGDPSIIAITAVIAHKAVGKLRLLKWDRITAHYIPMEINL